MESRDQLEKCLDITMSGHSPVLFVCCIPPGADKQKNTLSALQYVAKIRSCDSSNSYPEREDLPEKDKEEEDQIEGNYCKTEDNQAIQKSKQKVESSHQARLLNLHTKKNLQKILKELSEDL